MVRNLKNSFQYPISKLYAWQLLSNCSSQTVQNKLFPGNRSLKTFISRNPLLGFSNDNLGQSSAWLAKILQTYN